MKSKSTFLNTASQEAANPFGWKCRCLNPHFGLFPLINPDKPVNSKPLPLQNVSIKADIKTSVAKIEFTQTYVNDTDTLLEVEYYFPIPINSCFDSFKASYEGTLIEGVIKAKEEAKKEYNDNVKKGNTAAYAEIHEEADDTMKVLIGNIKPATTIEISFSYLQQLPVTRNRFYEFIFYSTVTTRNKPNSKKRGHDLELLSDYPRLPAEKGSFWNIEVSVECLSPISYIECESHKTETEQSDNPCQKKVRLVSSAEEAVFNKDFVLLYSEVDFNQPKYRLARNETGYCAMIDFVPKFSDESLDDAAIAAKKRKEAGSDNDDEANLMTATGEFIFLIDRSGSMDGQSIQMAKEALIFALKSLPPNAYFNILSFGSSYETMFQSNLEVSEKNIEQAIAQVKRFEADLGGTEILQPLTQVLKVERRRNHPRSIFLLTDGAVMNTAQVLSAIKNYNHRNRVYSLGIGDSCSRELVEKSAKKGKGKAEFVRHPNEIAGKVISLITAAISPVCDDFTLEYSDKSVVKMVSPEPSTHRYLLKDERATFFVFLSNEAVSKERYFEVSLQYFDTHSNKYNKANMKIDLEKYEPSLDVFKMGIWNVAKMLKNQEAFLPKESPDIYWAGKQSIKEEIVKMSIENQVLTKETAFICVVKENNKDEIGGLKKTKEIIPQPLSAGPLRKKAKGNSFFEEFGYARAGSRGGRGAGRGAVQFMTRGRSNKTVAFDDSDDEKEYGTRRRGHRTGRPGGRDEGFTELRSFMDSSNFEPSISKKAFLNPVLSKNSNLSADKNQQSSSPLLEVIQKQRIHGYWDDTTILEKLKIKMNELLDKASKAVQHTKASIETVLITLALLYWIEKYHQGDKSSWIMIHKKGQQWLALQGVKYAEAVSLLSFI